MADQTVFATERLVVRHWRPDDAPALLAIFGDAEVARWTSSPEPLRDLAEARERLERWATRRDDDRGLGAWAIVPVPEHDGDGKGRPVGMVLLRALDGVEEVEVGWALHPEVHGRGWATEAARGALEHARAHGHRRVRAFMYPDNDPSAAVCRRLGMRDLGEVADPWHGSEAEPTSRMFVLDLDPPRPHVRELGPGQTHRSHLAMAELRPHLGGDPAAFVARVDEVQRPAGYRLLASFDDPADEQAAGVAGFRAVRNLAWGDALYVDDLSVRETHRRRGHGAALLAAVADEARRLGCGAVHLDSGHQRHDAHRLYLANGYRMTSHHFVAVLT